jgi:hypothetical protein
MRADVARARERAHVGRYPNRLKYDEFVERYHLFDAGRSRELEPRAATTGLLSSLLGTRTDRPYQLGRTKVYFRVGELQALEERRQRMLGACARALQVACSSPCTQPSPSLLPRSPPASLSPSSHPCPLPTDPVVQAGMRRRLAIEYYADLRLRFRAALLLQSRLKAMAVRRRYERYRARLYNANAVRMQRVMRGFVGRAAFRHAVEAERERLRQIALEEERQRQRQRKEAEEKARAEAEEKARAEAEHRAHLLMLQEERGQAEAARPPPAAANTADVPSAPSQRSASPSTAPPNLASSPGSSRLDESTSPSRGGEDGDEAWSDGEDLMSMLNDRREGGGTPLQKRVPATDAEKQQARDSLAKQLGKGLRNDLAAHTVTGRWDHEEENIAHGNRMNAPQTARSLAEAQHTSRKGAQLQLQVLGQPMVSIKLGAKAMSSDGRYLEEEELEIAWARVFRDGRHEPIAGSSKMTYQVSADDLDKAIRVDIHEKLTGRVVHSMSAPIVIGAQLERIVKHYLNLGAAIFDLNLVITSPMGTPILEGRKLIVNTMGIKVKKNNTTQFKGTLPSSRHLVLEPGSLKMFLTLDSKREDMSICLQAHTPEERNLVALVVRSFQARPSDTALAPVLKQLAAECLYNVSQPEGAPKPSPPTMQVPQVDEAPPVAEKDAGKSKKSLAARLFKSKS